MAIAAAAAARAAAETRLRDVDMTGMRQTRRCFMISYFLREKKVEKYRKSVMKSSEKVILYIFLGLTALAERNCGQGCCFSSLT